jgi:queuosine precursor transporter
LLLSGRSAGIVVAVASMAAVVVLSNVLVQYPFAYSLGRLNLADLLTWGAFSYPLAFLVTDITNRLLGPATARRVVYLGFGFAVVLSVWASSPRIAIASGTAFLAGQLLDIGIFNRLRYRAWWKAPAFSSLVGSAADTVIFFTLAFAPAFIILGTSDLFAIEPAPLLGLYPVEAPRWVSWAAGDFAVKLLIDIVALIPYRVIVGWFVPLQPSLPPPLAGKS